MLKLGAWVWQSFHPGAQPLSVGKQTAEMAGKLLRGGATKIMAARDRWGEFADWFTTELFRESPVANQGC